MNDTPEVTGAIPEVTLGFRMQIALRHADLSTQGIADELGVSRSTVSRWLNDHGAPPRNGFVKLWAQATGVDPAWLREGKRLAVSAALLVPAVAAATVW